MSIAEPSPVYAVTHTAGWHHDTGPGHPERPARLEAVEACLADARAAGQVVWATAPAADDASLQRCHPARYLDSVFAAVPRQGRTHLDGDTVVAPASGEALRTAAGGAIAAAEAVMAHGYRAGLSACRPPGHHAEPSRAMGFCLVDNIAVAAHHLRAVHGLQRLAVVDFDVHHGNGTQAIAWPDPDFFYASTHQMPLFPGTGAPTERGAYQQIVNCPLDPMSGSERFREALAGSILPALRRFAPAAILISAGFDADGRDPLAQLNLGPADFGWATARLAEAADELCQGRVAAVLEGGYDLDALREGLDAVVTALHTREG